MFRKTFKRGILASVCLSKCFIETLEQALGQPAQKNFLPMQAGDVLATYADVEDLRQDLGFAPKTTLSDGLSRWAKWFRDYTQSTKSET